MRDLPEAWNAEMEQRLGFRPENDREGCLQDIHWAVGSFGYFPSYALGAVIAVQLIESLRNDVQDLDEQIARGEFAGLFGWLRTHVHGLGAKVTLQDLLQNATGKTLSAAPFMRYARRQVPRDRRQQRRGLRALDPHCIPAMRRRPRAAASPAPALAHPQRLAQLRGSVGKAHRRLSA